MHTLAGFITDFGDSAVTVPLAAVTIALLAVLRRPFLALGWGASVAGCAGAIGVFKLVLAGCAHRIALPDVASPSGHVAMSTVVYGGFALLFGSSLTPAMRRAAIAAAAVLIAAIAVSRLTLHLHSPAEILVGLAVGLGALAVWGAMLAAALPIRLPLVPVCLAAVMTMAVMHGTRWPAERAIHEFAHSGLFHDILPRCD